MSFWATYGRAWMAAGGQQICAHYDRLVRNLHRACPLSRVHAPGPLPTTQRRPPRQVLVLASSCVRSGLGCRAMQIGSWLRGFGLGQYEATFRNVEIDNASCSP
jgi:hypothetical protein